MTPQERVEHCCDEAKRTGLINHATGEGQPSISMLIDMVATAESNAEFVKGCDADQEFIQEANRLRAANASLTLDVKRLRKALANLCEAVGKLKDKQVTGEVERAYAEARAAMKGEK